MLMPRSATIAVAVGTALLATTSYPASSAQRHAIVDTLVRVSTSSSGAGSVQTSYEPAVAKPAPDGTTYPIIGFTHYSGDLIPGDDSGGDHVVTKNLTTGLLERWNTSSAGETGNSGSNRCVPSPYTKTVVFEALAKNLTPNDHNMSWDIYEKATSGPSPTPIKRISRSPSGADANKDSHNPDISVSGRYIVYDSLASNLVAGDANAASDIFLYNRAAGTNIRLSHATNGTAEGQGPSVNPSFQGNKDSVAFTSGAANLVAGDTNAATDIFIAAPSASGAVKRVSTTSSGGQANGDSSSPAFSKDGRYMVFLSKATNLVPDGATTFNQVYVKDLLKGTVTRVTETFDEFGAVVGGNGDSYQPAISPDGKFVAFSSRATNLYPLDRNKTKADIFVATLATDSISIVSRNADGDQGNNDSWDASFMNDSKHILFMSWASNLVKDDTNGRRDVFLVTLR